MSGDITKRQAASEVEILSRLDKRNDIKFIVKTPVQKPLFGLQDIPRMGKLSIIKNA